MKLKINKKLFYLFFTFCFIPLGYTFPTFNEVRSSYKSSEGILYDRYGNIIHEIRVSHKIRNLSWRSLSEISPLFLKSVIYSEDKRYYSHHGVDWIALFSSGLKNIFSKEKRGGSTITMQVVSLLEPNLRPKNSKRTLIQKWNQIRAALNLEKNWSKEEILEAYLNLISFRGELQGIHTASKGIFNKEPNGLNEIESIILASLIKSPNASLDKIIKRSCLLKKRLEYNFSCEKIKQIVEEVFKIPYRIKPKIAYAPHVAYQLLKNDKREAFSTIDGNLQKFAVEVLKSQLSFIRNKNVQDGAVLVVNNKSGEILAYVGNSGILSSAKYVDGVKALRQAGSTLKPFLYELAIEKGILTSASILEDTPIDIITPLGIYKPQNYDNDFKGKVSVRTSLSSSLNVPAVKTLNLIGVDLFVNRLKELGFTKIKESDYYGPSLALGSLDVSLYDLVNAYRTLANLGIWSPLKLELNEENNIEKEVMTKEASFIISDILSDREARNITFGLENPLSTRFFTAVKTGTSKDMRDNWCIGYSQKYTVGVWVGNFTGEPMWNVSGITGASPIWLEIMNYLHKNITDLPIIPPEGVISKRVKFENNIEQSRNEWFIKGFEPHSEEIKITSKDPYISYPIDNMIIGFDPDIPKEHSKVFFEAKNVNKDLFWVLNGKYIGDAKKPHYWEPEKGNYLLNLIDKENNIISSVRFEVR